jgi:hypothetical protein
MWPSTKLRIASVARAGADVAHCLVSAALSSFVSLPSLRFRPTLGPVSPHWMSYLERSQTDLEPGATVTEGHLEWSCIEQKYNLQFMQWELYVDIDDYIFLGFEVFTAVVYQRSDVLLPPSSGRSRGTKDIWIAGILLPDHSVLQPKRQPTSTLFSFFGQIFRKNEFVNIWQTLNVVIRKQTVRIVRLVSS